MKVYTVVSKSKLPSKGLCTDLLSFLASSQQVLSLDGIANGSRGAERRLPLCPGQACGENEGRERMIFNMKGSVLTAAPKGRMGWLEDSADL